MNENQNNNRGVFPGNPVPSQGTIQTGPPVQGLAKAAAAQPAAAAPNLSHHDTVENAEIVPTDGATTFIRLETKNPEGQISGIIEVDLISFREKGQESRFLSINTTGADGAGNESTTAINIDNEADFNRFKKFISELNWND